MRCLGIPKAFFMLPFFLHFCVSTEIISRKFVECNSNFTGDWEYVDQAEYRNGTVNLISNIPKTRGGMYFQNRLPSEKWAANISLDIANISLNSLSSIWITKDYAPSGVVFGGPLAFQGVSVLLLCSNKKLSVEVRENDGKGKYMSYSFFPAFNCVLSSGNITIEISYLEKSGKITIFHDNDKKVLFNDKFRVSIRRYWLGINAINTRNASIVTVKSAIINGTGLTSRCNQGGVPKTPFFGAVNQTGNFTAQLVLDHLDSFYNLSHNLFSKLEIKEMVYREMIPFSDSWQRRSISIMQNSFNLKNKLLENLNYTKNAISSLEEEITTEVSEIRDDIRKIASEMYYGILNGNVLSDSLDHIEKGAIRNPLHVSFIVISLIEVLAITFFSVWKLVQIHCFKNN